MTTFLPRAMVGTFALVAFAVLLPTPVSAASLSLSPTAGTVNATTAMTVTVTLNTEGARVDGADVRLRFDPSKLQVTGSVTEGAIFNTYPAKTIDNTAGRISISGIVPIGSPYTGTGTLATFQLRAVQGASGTATVSFIQDSTRESIVSENGTARDVLTSVQNATLTIGTGTSGSISTPSGGTGGVAQLPSTASPGPMVLLAGLGIGFVLAGLLGLRRLFLP